MDYYYLYLVGDDGHIKAREVLSAHDESEAVARAEAYLQRHTSVPSIELWRDERRIMSFEQTATA